MNTIGGNTFKTEGAIFLVGLMGSGKSYWGNLLAEQMGNTFIDLDELIVQQENKTIVELFEQNGETWFRQKETATLKTIAEKKDIIIACGGGTPCFNNNMQWMNERGTTVYLAAAPTDIVKRISTEQEKRPLIKNLTAQELSIFVEKQLKEREPFYTMAKITLQVNEITPATIKEILLTKMNA
jgi:shikimate kinase